MNEKGISPPDKTNNWITIREAMAAWRAAPCYERLYRMVKQSRIETRKRGRYLTFRLADLRARQERQEFFRALAKGMQGDWYTRSLNQ
jgi:hypothetical protein